MSVFPSNGSAETNGATYWANEIAIELGLTLTPPPYSGDEENRLAWILSQIYDVISGGGGGGPFWRQGGNAVTSEQTLGTTTNYALPVIINNSEVWAWETNGTISRSGDLWSAAYSRTNTTWGYNAGSSISGAANVTLIGALAGINLTSGATNTLVGYNTGGSLSTGTSNTLIGGNAGAALSATSAQNTFVGAGAGGNATADKNAFFGYNAGAAQTSGIFNVALGAYAGRNFFSGYANSAANANIYIGQGAGDGQKSGSYNIFIGLSGGYNFQDGNRNILIGNTVISTSYGAGNITQPYPTSSTNDTLGFGNLVQFTGSNQIVFGSQTYRYDQVFFGEGTASTSPQPFTYSRTNASGLDQVGAQTYIDVSRGTGLGASGNIIFRYAPAGSSGTTLTTLTDGFRFEGTTGSIYVLKINDLGNGLPLASSGNTTNGYRIELDSTGGSWIGGDVQANSNKTQLIVNDSAQSLTLRTGGGSPLNWILFDIANSLFKIGDIDTSTTSMLLTVDVPNKWLILDSGTHDSKIKINGVEGVTASVDPSAVNTLEFNGGVFVGTT